MYVETVYPIRARKLNPHCVKNDAKLRSGVRDLEQDKHQLLHRVQSVRTSLIYNTMKNVKKRAFSQYLATIEGKYYYYKMIKNLSVIANKQRRIRD